MSLTEGKQRQFEVKIDDHGDFKIIPKSMKSVTTTKRSSKKPLIRSRPVTTEGSKKFTKTPIKRRKGFIPTGLSKKEIQKIRKNVSIQRIADYVRIVSPDDGIVNEKALFAFIKWHLFKKYPEKYLEVIKKKEIMIPCGEGKLKFTRRW